MCYAFLLVEHSVSKSQLKDARNREAQPSFFQVRAKEGPCELRWCQSRPAS